MATALGNDSTDKITILDQKTSKILFSGADQDDDATVVSDSLDIKDRIKNSVVNGIKDVMVKSGMYSDVQVAPNLDIDMSKVEKAVHNYSHNDGQDQGELTESSEYNSEAKGGQAATPGTDSNDDTPTYVTQDGEITESSVSDVDKKYSPNEEIIKTISNGGAINYDNSSIAVTATRWVVYDEDELKDSGQLKGTTFEKFKSAHSDPVQVDATQDEIDLIAKATGIQSSAIKLVCYERPQFVEKFKEEIPRYMVKHQVRPGLTGWAQVNGLRGDSSIKKRIEYDIYYIENWTIGFDIKIILMTFFTGFINKNAY